MCGAFFVILTIGSISFDLVVFLGLAFYEKSLWVFGGPLGSSRTFLEVSVAYWVNPVEVEMVIKR